MAGLMGPGVEPRELAGINLGLSPGQLPLYPRVSALTQVMLRPVLTRGTGRGGVSLPEDVSPGQSAVGLRAAALQLGVRADVRRVVGPVKSEKSVELENHVGRYACIPSTLSGAMSGVGC